MSILTLDASLFSFLRTVTNHRLPPDLTHSVSGPLGSDDVVSSRTPAEKVSCNPYAKTKTDSSLRQHRTTLASWPSLIVAVDFDMFSELVTLGLINWVALPSSTSTT
jgi:hypothetical protein